MSNCLMPPPRFAVRGERARSPAGPPIPFGKGEGKTNWRWRMSYRTDALVVSLAVATTGCQESWTAPHVVSANTSLDADRSTGDTPNYNLEVILRPCSGDVAGCLVGGDGFGHVKFRQSGNDDVQRIDLGVWVRDLAPNTAYFLQRAVDTNLNGSCTSTSWLTLGFGTALPPQSITTDDRGTGSEDLFRIVPNPAGSTFDIHFRIVQAGANQMPDPNKVVLVSDCYQYSVR